MAGTRYGRRLSEVYASDADSVGDYPMVDLENGRSSKADINDDAKSHYFESESPPHQECNQGDGTMEDGGDESETLLLPDDVQNHTSRLRKRPNVIHRLLNAIVEWAKGPNPPRPYKIEPYFPRFQKAPIRLLDKYLPSRSSRVWAFLVFTCLWIIAFASILFKSVAGTEIPGYGTPVRLSCISRLW
jgi:hypothetical protein